MREWQTDVGPADYVLFVDKQAVGVIISRGRRENWHEIENLEGRWRKFTYEQILARDKSSLDIFWLKDKSLADVDNLPEPDDLVLVIIDNLEAGLNSFHSIANALQQGN